jgi:dephospho-CoA kinase
MTTPTIGLTGGIAMGKTRVANLLADRYQFSILDADMYAREAVQPGSAVLQRIIDRYSPRILRPDGSLDRAQLGTIVFADAHERQWLEQQIHPHVRQAMRQAQQTQQTADPDRPVVLVIPLLFEAGLTDWVETIWVVRCTTAQQLERLMARDRLTLDQAQDRIQSQMSIEEKCDRADIVLDNSSTSDHLIEQLDRAVNTLRG